MKIRAKENQLFKEWAKKRKPFVRDGVVSKSEKDYLQSEPKIVFILKEANDNRDENGDWGLEKYYGLDLRKYLDAGARWQTWDNVVRWVDGIRKFRETGRWAFYDEDITEDFRKETLKSICSMNLKKTPGGSSTKPAELRRFAEEDGNFIQKQYNLYNPDITICGGTGKLFRQVMGHEHLGRPLPKKAWWYERKKGKYVICAKHPQARRISSKQLQKELMDVIRKIYK